MLNRVYRDGIVTGENSVLHFHRDEDFDGTSYPILALHGSGSTGHERFFSPGVGPSYHRYVKQVAIQRHDKRFIVLSVRHGGNTWGSAAARALIVEGYEWLIANGALDTPAGIYAASMGAVSALDLWNSEPDIVGPLWLNVPVFNTMNFYDDNAGAQAEMDDDFSGNYKANATSPHTFTLPDRPVVVEYASDDANVRPEDTLAGAVGLGADIIDIAPGGHLATANELTPHQDVADFFAENI